jgi:hypothetical protein
MIVSLQLALTDPVRFNRNNIIVFKDKTVTRDEISRLLQRFDCKMFEPTKLGTCVEVKNATDRQIARLLGKLKSDGHEVYAYSDLHELQLVEHKKRERKRKR